MAEMENLTIKVESFKMTWTGQSKGQQFFRQKTKRKVFQVLQARKKFEGIVQALI